MAQRLGPALLEKAPKVDLVVGPDAYRNLPELIGHALAGGRPSDTGFRSREHYEDVPQVRTPGPTQFVTVQRGCGYRCTFCIVPYTRGPERSRKLEEVVREVGELAAAGTSEVTLLGQTVNSYHDGRHDFAHLLRAVGTVDGIRRLRFTSPYPTDFTDRVIEAMVATPAVCEHVHLPVQSGSNAVLRRMLRRYTRESYLEIVARLRAAMPAITLSTDVIVGFPGETDAQFEETVSLVREAEFDDAYPFRYSVRDGTPAARLADRVAEDVSAGRLARLIDAVRGQARARNLARVGAEHEILVERPARRGGLLLGRTRTNHLVLVDLPCGAIRSGRPGPGTLRASARSMRSWWSGRRGAAGCCSAGPAPITSCWWTCPAARSASITGCASPAPPAPLSPGPSRPPNRCPSYDPQPCRRARAGGLQRAAGPFPGLLRLRNLPGGRVDLSPQPAAGAVRGEP